ncbi:MAG: putative cobalt transporter subunit (CbtB) [Halonotius sp. J07HN4]|jgi:Probable cobalt transporter subunit (CbtB).|nr:MAG: putative cobalt transporter subunit (CbtB) [Halonotius sp. J07HN4]
MTAHNDTVADRIDTARAEIAPTTALGILAFGAAITFALLVLQEPLAHDSMHNFRHAAGIVCH